MRPKSLVLLILALGCGLVASIGISEIIDSQGSNTASVETEPILVAKTDIERSTPLSAENLMLEEWPKDKVPVGAIRDLAEVESRRPMSKITQGMPLLEGMIGSGEAGSVSGEIPKGYRVVGVTVNAKTGANLIRPGDRVDLQLFARAAAHLGVKETVTRVFLEDITVFAVNQQIRTETDDQQGQARTVSLLVTPDQAAKVTLATEIGTVSVVMRGGQDDDTDTDIVATVGELLYGEGGKHEVLTNDDQDTTAGGGSTMQDFLRMMAQGKQPPAGALPGMPGLPDFDQDGPYEMVVVRGPDITVEQFDGEAPLAKVTGEYGDRKSSEDSSRNDSDENSDSADSDSDSDDGGEQRVNKDE